MLGMPFLKAFRWKTLSTPSLARQPNLWSQPTEPAHDLLHPFDHPEHPGNQFEQKFDAPTSHHDSSVPDVPRSRHDHQHHFSLDSSPPLLEIEPNRRSSDSSIELTSDVERVANVQKLTLRAPSPPQTDSLTITSCSSSSSVPTHQPTITCHANGTQAYSQPLSDFRQISVVHIGCCPKVLSTSSVNHQLHHQSLKSRTPSPSSRSSSSRSFDWDFEFVHFSGNSFDVRTMSSRSESPTCTAVTGTTAGTTVSGSLPVSSSTSPTSCLVETVHVYRAPNERLGMALKFEGGACANEPVQHVYIQSIGDDSPAGRAIGSRLLRLREHDEILEIDGRPVQRMSRLQCVACLRDTPSCIRLTVRRPIVASPSSSTVGPLLISFAPFKSSSPASSPASSASYGMTTDSIGRPAPTHPAPPAPPELPVDVVFDANTLRRCKGPPPCIPPRLSTTVLSNRCFATCDSITMTTMTTMTTAPTPVHSVRPPHIPKRPSQPPPLPPRKLEATFSNRPPSGDHPDPLISRSDTQVNTKKAPNTSTSTSTGTGICTPIHSATTLTTNSLSLLKEPITCSNPPAADFYVDSLHTIQVSHYKLSAVIVLLAKLDDDDDNDDDEDDDRRHHCHHCRHLPSPDNMSFISMTDIFSSPGSCSRYQLVQMNGDHFTSFSL